MIRGHDSIIIRLMNAENRASLFTASLLSLLQLSLLSKDVPQGYKGLIVNRPFRQKSLDRALSYTISYMRFDRVALEVLSLLCTFENSSNCIITSFDSDSFLE